MFDYGKGIRNPLFFVGVVEEVVDPRREGRVKVRAFGTHGLNTDIRKEDLPWAICVKGDYDPNGTIGSGIPALNSFVFGMFLDGIGAQQPMVLGLIPTQYTEQVDPVKNGYGAIPRKNAELLMRGSAPEDFGQPQNSRRSRGEYSHETQVTDQNANRTENVGIAGSESTWSEPSSSYNPQYPFNKVIESGSHVIELDDTKGAERISIYHKSGSYMQIDHRGVTINKSVDDQYTVLDRNEHKVVGKPGSSGFSTVTINGNSYVKVNGHKTEQIQGDYKVEVGGNYYLDIAKQGSINAGIQFQARAADVKIEANVSNLSIKAEKEIQIQSGQATAIKSDYLYMQALTELNMKAALNKIEGTDSIEIYGEAVEVTGTNRIDISGDQGVIIGSDEDISINTPKTVHIDTNVNMANDGADTPSVCLPCEEGLDATNIELPEPTTEKIVLTDEDPESHGGGGGVTSGDDAEGVTDTEENQVPSTAVTQSKLTPLLDLIARKEANFKAGKPTGYDSISNQIPPALFPSKPITQMTIGEILDYQNRIDEFDPKINSEAMGRYQFVEDTLRGFNNDEYNTLSLAYKANKGEKPVYEKAGLSKSDLFSAQNQDLLAIERLKFRGLNNFLDNKISIVFYANKLSAEWASLPIVSGIHAGKSTYEGDGINKATGDIQEVLDTLKALNPKWEDFYK